MRVLIPLMFLATPAFAHHEAVVVSVLPGLMVWLAALSAAGFSAWRWRRVSRKQIRSGKRK